MTITWESAMEQYIYLARSCKHLLSSLPNHPIGAVQKNGYYQQHIGNCFKRLLDEQRILFNEVYSLLLIKKIAKTLIRDFPKVFTFIFLLPINKMEKSFCIKNSI